LGIAEHVRNVNQARQPPRFAHVADSRPEDTD
jgi:hypothetical protein